MELLSEVGWSLDLTPQENYRSIQMYSPQIAERLQRPISNLHEIVLYYPLNENQDYFDRVRYYGPSITLLEILITITEYYKSPVPERTFRAAQRGFRANYPIFPTRRDLLGDHAVLVKVYPYEDGYALYFS